jgi:energy-coupling factor transporter ATP-binding protein EcfA2
MPSDAAVPNVSENKNDPYEHAFGLLVSTEIGAWPTWTPVATELRPRIETLALCMGVIPRIEAAQLDSIVQAWQERFPERRPVTAGDLRLSALELLRPSVRGTEGSPGDGEGFRKAIALVKASSAGEGVGPELAVQDRDFSEGEARRQCAFGLGLWFTQVATHDRWRYLPAIVPGEAPAEIDKIYVELYAVCDEDTLEDQQIELRGSQRQSQRLLATQYPAVSLTSMVSRTMQRCIVMGEPGSGKSTLVQWLAWAVNQGKCPDFDGALVVRLSGFATALTEEPNLTLLEYFFTALDTNIQDWRPGAHWMRRLASSYHRFLLLLDGWDEVPLPQRETVRQRIVEEQPHFIVLITSRPSGLPRQLGEGERTDFYFVAGLTPAAMEDLVQKLLKVQGRIDLLESILGRIIDEPDLQEMAANPFLLGLMVRAFVRTAGSGSSPRTRAEVYHQVVSWMREQYNLGPGGNDSLTPEHMVCLRRLSHFLLFKCDPPRYAFRGEELADSMRGGSAEAVRRSRFVNRTDPVYDEFAFLHATFQEYLAAERSKDFSDQDFERFFDQAFASVSRLLVLEFVAGLAGPVAEHCRRSALQWFERRDRFGQVVLRLSRVAAAGRWPIEAGEGLGRSLREELWEEIRGNRNMPLTKAAAEAFADLDPEGLAARARTAQGLDNWAIQCIVDAVPRSIARKERLDELLHGMWREYAGFDARGGATEADRHAIRATLARRDIDRDDLSTAVIHAGATQDAAAVPLLLSLLAESAEDQDLQRSVIDSLGTIGGREAVDALIDVVLGDLPASDEGVTSAIAVLHHSGARRKALDPPGRDRLLRRLAVLAPEDARVEKVLEALEACPLREGVGLIAELARCRSYDASLRFAAIQALTAAIDRRQVQQLVLEVESEQSSSVVDGLLNLAVIRAMYVPLEWLEQKISAARDKLKRREFLSAFLVVLPLATGRERQQAEAFIGRVLAQALSNEGELAWALERALSGVAPGKCPLPPSVLPMARDILAKFSEAPNSIPSASVRLAASVLVHCNESASVRDIRKALDVALEWSGEPAEEVIRVQRALVNSLVELAPGELLGYPPDCECVRSALCQMAVQRGWLIYRDRIVGAEGFEIASIEASEEARRSLGEPPDLKELIELLPEQSQRVLYGYWLMVKEDGPCRPRDSQRKIYDAMAVRLDGTIEDEQARSLDSLFPDGLPQFDSWRKALKRIEDRFAEEVEMLAILRRIGLCRRRRR